MAVYFIRNTENGCVKVGYSIKPQSRLRQLQTANPDRLKLMGVIHGGPDLEAELHRTFENFRLSGEWFWGDPGLVTYIRAIIADPRRLVWDSFHERLLLNNIELWILLQGDYSAGMYFGHCLTDETIPVF